MAYTTGPYRIVRQLNFLNYSIQKSPNAKPFVVHIDRLKRYEGDTPESWRRIIEREKSSYSETVLDVTQNHAPQGIVMNSDVSGKETVESGLQQTGIVTTQQAANANNLNSIELDNFDKQMVNESVVNAKSKISSTVAPQLTSECIVEEQLGIERCIRPRRKCQLPARLLD